jgi:hypothetical protein
MTAWLTWLLLGLRLRLKSRRLLLLTGINLRATDGDQSAGNWHRRKMSAA